MAGFTSYDQIIESLSSLGKGQEIWFSKNTTSHAVGTLTSMWAYSGLPAAGGYGGTPLTGRACDNTTTGALSFMDAGGSETLHLIGISAMPTVASMGTLILYDRVMDIPSIDATTTSAQSITTASFPRYADGAGLRMFLEVTTALGTGTGAAVIKYTDQDGNAGVSTPSFSTVASSSVNKVAHGPQPWIPLAAGDTGLQAVSEIQFSVAHSTGALNLVVARPLAMVPVFTAAGLTERDFVLQMPKLPEIPDGAALAFLLMPGSTATGTVTGTIQAVSR